MRITILTFLLAVTGKHSYSQTTILRPDFNQYFTGRKEITRSALRELGVIE